MSDILLDISPGQNDRPLDQASPLNTRSSSGDALLTQRKLAHYLVEERSAHYVFTAKDNQPSIAEAIRLPFENR
ncbi:hypothetical protein, partial [Thiolapillus sp.]|uniref:hypothetical protein n=1 Tax=Thiolapillus sp. TaxID=2017437 RepID=UPI003AF7B569